VKVTVWWKLYTVHSHIPLRYILPYHRAQWRRHPVLLLGPRDLWPRPLATPPSARPGHHTHTYGICVVYVVYRESGLGTHWAGLAESGAHSGTATSSLSWRAPPSPPPQDGKFLPGKNLPPARAFLTATRAPPGNTRDIVGIHVHRLLYKGTVTWKWMKKKKRLLSIKCFWYKVNNKK
jgi:hypothetical protein